MNAAIADKNTGSDNDKMTVLELVVNNHPGVMSHICGLFSRRAYNVEGIVCVPSIESGGRESKMWLQVNEEKKLDQIVSQVEKLEDVKNVCRYESGHEIFNDVYRYG